MIWPKIIATILPLSLLEGLTTKKEYCTNSNLSERITLRLAESPSNQIINQLENFLFLRNRPWRLFEGAAYLRRMYRYGFFTTGELKLDYAFGLIMKKIFDRKLQARIYQDAFHAKTVHQARVITKQKRIKVDKNLINVLSFNVWIESEKKINLMLSFIIIMKNKKLFKLQLLILCQRVLKRTHKSHHMFIIKFYPRANYICIDDLLLISRTFSFQFFKTKIFDMKNL